MKPSYYIILKTSKVCNAGCITCPGGRKRPDDESFGGLMKPEQLKRILQKVKSQANITSLTYHFYNEPTINPYIAELIEVGQKHKINGVMSTNGSFFKPIPKILELGLKNIIISVSGFTQSIHERSHAGINIEEVKENMRKISRLKKSSTYVRVSWHRYSYNAHEEHLMEEFASSLGFHFTPYNTGVLPLERVEQRWKDGLPDIAERDLITKLPEAHELCLDRKHWNCILQDRIITIDAEGYIFVCSGRNHDANRYKTVFEIPLEEFHKWRKEQSEVCKACKATGLHVYAMQQYREPNNFLVTSVKKAEDVWRQSGLGGLFPSFSAWWTNNVYWRPVKK